MGVWKGLKGLEMQAGKRGERDLDCGFGVDGVGSLGGAVAEWDWDVGREVTTQYSMDIIPCQVHYNIVCISNEMQGRSNQGALS
jgi:hypothetical protein